MGATFSATTTGAYGDILAGWTVNLDATPVNPSDTSAGTGSVSFGVGQGKDSEYLIESAGVFNHDYLGTINGFVKSIDSLGQSVATDTTVPVEFSTPLSGLVAERAAQGFVVGSRLNDLTFPVADYRGVAIGGFQGTTIYTSSNSANRIQMYSVLGAPAGSFGATEAAGGAGTNGTIAQAGEIVLDSSANLYTLDFAGTANHQRIQKFTSTGVYVNKWGTTGTGNSQFSATNATLASISIDDSLGEIYVSDPGNLRIQVFNTSGTYLRQWAVPSTPLSVRFDIATTNLVYVLCSDGNIYSYTASGGSQTILATGVSANSPLVANFGVSYFGVSASGAKSLIQLGTAGQLVGQYAAPYTGNRYIGYAIGAAPAIYLEIGNTTTAPSALQYVMDFGGYLSHVVAYYLALVLPQGIYSLVVDFSAEKYIQYVPGWRGSVWSYLRDLCSAFIVQIVADGTTIRVLPAVNGTVSIEDSNQVRISLDNTLPAASVKVVNYRHSNGYNQIILTPDSPYTVATRQTQVFYVQTDHTITYINPMVQSITPNGAGSSYVVSDASNQIVSFDAFTGMGGKVEGFVDPATPGLIRVVVTGPQTAPLGYTGPWTVGGTEEATRFYRTAFTMTGVALTSDPAEIEILTGASRSRPTDSTASPVDNIFLANASMAYDRGVWATVEESGPQMVLTGTIPSWRVGTFIAGLGSKITHKDNSYRIQNLVVGDLTTNFTATRHVTVAEFDALWAGKTVSQRDAFWSGKRCMDTSIKTLLIP